MGERAFSNPYSFDCKDCQGKFVLPSFCCVLTFFVEIQAYL